MEQNILSIEEAFGDLRDPRGGTVMHDLMEMLVVALCAILCDLVPEKWTPYG